MPDEFACQECGYTQEMASDGEGCPFCGGKFVNLNDDLATMDDHYGQDEAETDQAGDEDFGVGEGYSSAI